MNNILLESALKYQSIGFPIIPIKQTDKKPFIKWEEYQKRVSTVDEINSWWTKWPHAMIGIVTGKISNLFVADLDKYKKDFSEELALKYFPDSLITPTSISPQGGEHLYFSFPDNFKNGGRSDGNIAIDFRAEGNYIIAPPSYNGIGKSYEWVHSIFDTPLQKVPDTYIAYIINSTLYRGVTKNNTDISQSVTINLNSGGRDQSLFHIANLLAKGGADREEILIVLNLLAKQCNPPFPENEIVIKCDSALERNGRKERNIQKEVEDFVSVTTGHFSVTDCHNMTQCVTKNERHSVRMALSRLKERGIIEKYGQKDGVYRRIEKEFEFINFDEHEALEVEYPVKLPLGINDIAEISQGNIILVAGEFNSGKTAFLLNVLKDNKDKLPIRYITSEMSKSEFKKRFANFGLPLSFWVQSEMTDYVKKSSDFHSALRPDAINIIDYMEFRDADFTRGAEYLTQIHDKLTTGIAIVAVQKKEGTRMPRSGDLIVEKPRLALSFSKLLTGEENPQGCCEILKCKMPKLGKIDGKKCKFEITNRGSGFHIMNDWGFWRF